VPLRPAHSVNDEHGCLALVTLLAELVHLERRVVCPNGQKLRHSTRTRRVGAKLSRLEASAWLAIVFGFINSLGQCQNQLIRRIAFPSADDVNQSHRCQHVK